MSFAKLLIAGALVSASAGANAATFVFLPGQGDVLASENVVFDFNNPANDSLVTGNNFRFLTGSSGEGALPAAGDGSRYLSVLGGGNATIAFGGNGATGFSLDIGSVDAVNVLTLNFVGGTTQVFTGSDLVANPNGNQQADATNGRFRFSLAAGDPRIASLTFASGANSFEVDRLAVAGIPEPATWAMMIGGFGVIGAAARRRSRAQVTYA